MLPGILWEASISFWLEFFCCYSNQYSPRLPLRRHDRWRYHYPKYDTSGKFRKVGPSQELSDYLVSKFKDIV